MTNREKLRDLFIDVFLLDLSEFSFDLCREQIETWDSLGVVSLAVGLHETFGHHLTPEEATGISSVQDVMDILKAKGIQFDR